MNIKENTLFKLEVAIFNDKFNVDNLHLYQLNMYLDNQSLNIFVYNAENNRALLLEKYSFQDNIQNNNLIEALEAIFSGHSYINAGFWKEIKVIFKSQNFTFLPNAIFDFAERENYLKLCTEFNDKKESILVTKSPGLSLTTVYSIEDTFLKFFRNRYPAKEVKICSHINTFINLLSKEKLNKGNNELFIFAQVNKITIVKFNKEELQYANIFDFRSSEDLTYYTLLVINELGLNPDIINLTLWGNMDINSIYFKRLSEYVKNISIGIRPEGLNFGYQFDEIDEAQFYDLMGASL